MDGPADGDGAPPPPLADPGSAGSGPADLRAALASLVASGTAALTPDVPAGLDLAGSGGTAAVAWGDVTGVRTTGDVVTSVADGRGFAVTVVVGGAGEFDPDGPSRARAVRAVMLMMASSAPVIVPRRATERRRERGQWWDRGSRSGLVDRLDRRRRLDGVFATVRPRRCCRVMIRPSPVRVPEPIEPSGLSGPLALSGPLGPTGPIGPRGRMIVLLRGASTAAATRPRMRSESGWCRPISALSMPRSRSGNGSSPRPPP